MKRLKPATMLKTFAIAFFCLIAVTAWLLVADNMIAIYLVHPDLSCTSGYCKTIMDSPIYAIIGVLMNCLLPAAFITYVASKLVDRTITTGLS